MDRLSLVNRSLEEFEGLLQLAVHEVGVDQSCSKIAVAEGTLDYQDVPGSTVEVGGEGVPEGMWAEFLIDARSCKPVLQPPGDLTLAEPLAAVGEEQGSAFSVTPACTTCVAAGRPASALCQVRSEEGA